MKTLIQRLIVRKAIKIIRKRIINSNLSYGALEKWGIEDVSQTGPLTPMKHEAVIVITK